MGLLAAIKSALRFPGYGGEGIQRHGIADWLSWGASQGYDYHAAAGELHRNGVVMACASFLMRAFPEPALQVVKEEPSTGEENEVPKHPLTLALRRPNDYYGSDCLWQRVIFDRAIHGQAFLYKERNASGQIIALWHVPQHRLIPQWPSSGRQFLSHWLFTIEARQERVPVEDVVCFRFGGDPQHERCGLAGLGANLREIAQLNEGANYRGALLRNMGVPSHLVQSKDPARPIGPEQAAHLHALWQERVSGANRGRPVIPNFPLEALKIGMSPAEMDLGEMNWEATDQICAQMAVPAQVIGLSSGSKSKTYANQREARESVTENTLVPMWAQVAQDLTLQLLPDYSDDPAELVRFDLSTVRALQEDQTALWTRVDAAVKTGWITANEGRSFVNLPPIKGGDELRQAKPAPAGFANGAGEPGQGSEVQAEQPGSNGNGREPAAAATGRASTNGSG